MRRLTLVVLTLTLAALIAAPAHAKGIAKLEACGSNGCRDATATNHDSGVLEGGPQIEAPQHRAPFFELHVTIGGPDVPDGPPIEILYVPSLHAMRATGTDRTPRWMRPTAHSEAALWHATARLVPFDASRLDLSTSAPAIRARVDEVVPAPRTGDPPSSGTDWLGWAAGGSVAALLMGAGRALLRRRRGRPAPHPAR